jgi:gamma-glutamyltranspeptidase/glutathione hydrolase
LAQLIRRLGDEGLASFYNGEIARTIARQVQAGGGTLSEADFGDFRASLLEPLHINYRGYDLYTPPPPSAGLTAFGILKTLEQFDLPKFKSELPAAPRRSAKNKPARRRGPTIRPTP